MPEVVAPQESKPLLTIAIPTYNRAMYLRELLESLLPQLAEIAQSGEAALVQVLISDNAATDETPTVTSWAEEFAKANGFDLQVVRRAENIGSDRNFVACFNEARGRYFWLLGDDDIIRPGGIAGILHGLRQGDYDLVFLTPQAFYKDWQAEFVPDPWGRTEQVVTSARHITRIINVGITFISGYIVHRDRVMQVALQSPDEFVGTNLVQLSWSLPLLREHRKSLVLWQRFVSGRAMNSGGYNIAEVFGERFLAVVHRLLPDKPRLATIFPDFALRRWFPATVHELRQRSLNSGRTGVHSEGTEVVLRRLFAGNFRYWLFTWPVLRLPLGAAETYLRASEKVNKVVDLLMLPGDTLGKLSLRVQRRSLQAK